MEIVLSVVLAFAISIAMNIWLAKKLSEARQKISERDDLIADLQSAIGGTEREDWRKSTL